MSACTSTALDTSVLTKIASPPFSVIIWTVCCPPSSFRSAMTSLAPSLAKVSAVALPIPEAPPVTNATLPSSCPGMVGSPSLVACIEVVSVPYRRSYHTRRGCVRRNGHGSGGGGGGSWVRMKVHSAILPSTALVYHGGRLDDSYSIKHHRKEHEHGCHREQTTHATHFCRVRPGEPRTLSRAHGRGL